MLTIALTDSELALLVLGGGFVLGVVLHLALRSGWVQRHEGVKDVLQLIVDELHEHDNADAVLGTAREVAKERGLAKAFDAVVRRPAPPPEPPAQPPPPAAGGGR